MPSDQYRLMVMVVRRGQLPIDTQELASSDDGAAMVMAMDKIIRQYKEQAGERTTSKDAEGAPRD